ncbi:MAG: hypothetical protein ABL912_01990 [Novosphingobium sp.]
MKDDYADDGDEDISVDYWDIETTVAAVRDDVKARAAAMGATALAKCAAETVSPGEAYEAVIADAIRTAGLTRAEAESIVTLAYLAHSLEQVLEDASDAIWSPEVDPGQ